MNEVALPTIQMSVKPGNLNTATSVDTANEAWDALTIKFKARDNFQLLRFTDELSSVKKGDDENIIKFASRAKMIRDKLAMLGNPVEDNTLALRVLSGLPSENGILRTFLEKKVVKLVMSDVTATLLQVEQRKAAGDSWKPAGDFKSQAFPVAAPKKPFDKKSVACEYCDKKGHMKRDCYKRGADETKGMNKPGGRRRDRGHGGGPQAGAARAYTDQGLSLIYLRGIHPGIISIIIRNRGLDDIFGSEYAFLSERIIIDQTAQAAVYIVFFGDLLYSSISDRHGVSNVWKRFLARSR